MVAQLWIDLLVLDILFKRYKSNREKYHNFYEKELFQYRHKPISLLQVGIESSIPVWQKYLQRCNVYCIDEFDRSEPNRYKYLNEKRVFWSRCDTSNEKSIKNIMNNIWNKPRFDIIIDNINNFAMSRQKYLNRYCIGKYYIEDGDDVRIMK